jgi:hypothetical protein
VIFHRILGDPERSCAKRSRLCIFLSSQPEGDEGSAVVLPTIPPQDREEPEQILPIRNPGCSLHASSSTEDTPQPTQIQTLKALAEDNSIASHTYKSEKKQPASFHTLAEKGGRG